LGTFTAELKIAIGKECGDWFNLGENFCAKKDCVLLMRAIGDDYTMAFG
jgi:hypothetical protein